MRSPTIAKLTARNVRPLHTHDCTACVFLGILDGLDLYACKDGSLIRRFGERSSYGSLPADIAPPAGSPYAFAAVLLARSAVPGFTPNTYRSVYPIEPHGVLRPIASKRAFHDAAERDAREVRDGIAAKRAAEETTECTG